MNILISALVALLVSNSVKFALFLSKGGKVSGSSLFWHYVWTGKFPSSHSAAFGAAVYALWHQEGFSSLAAFSILVSIFVMYTLIENKKRYQLLEAYYIQSNDEAMKLLVSERKMADFEGHTFLEIIAGAVLGILVAALIGIYV